MSEPKPNGTDLFMAIVSGMSGPKASEGWTCQKLENDITWLASELTRMKDENARLKAEVERWSVAGELMLDHLNTGWASEHRVIEAIEAAKEGKQS